MRQSSEPFSGFSMGLIPHLVPSATDYARPYPLRLPRR
jgi:hypothetical protein